MQLAISVHTTIFGVEFVVIMFFLFKQIESFLSMKFFNNTKKENSVNFFFFFLLKFNHIYNVHKFSLHSNGIMKGPELISCLRTPEVIPGKLEPLENPLQSQFQPCDLKSCVHSYPLYLDSSRGDSRGTPPQVKMWWVTTSQTLSLISGGLSTPHKKTNKLKTSMWSPL